MNDFVKMGKYISLILRHKPEIINLKIDEHGWANVDELLKGINNSGRYISKEMLNMIVETNDKKRYQYNNDHTKIRANQGHSIRVDVELHEKVPPDVLYHGTAQEYLDKIRKSGIRKMNRLYVHLSKDMETAMRVGKRHGQPIVLIINTKAMINDGYKFYYSNNGVWLCDDIAYSYIEEVIT